MQQNSFTHLKDDGSATMVDVGDKSTTRRVAVASATVILNPQTFALLQQKALPKGDVLTTAKIAGVMAAKRTAELIPFCHSLGLNFVDISFELEPEKSSIHIRSEARLNARTGVEMEALCAAQIAALTIYDMCKAVQKDIQITNCRLLHKSGGRSGEYNAK
ncbi:cyclic pyranopterin monophosphate synthase MoaC [Desulfovibrio sp. OttesenSCG-928-F07]|nr:cyclic pyranopterin monophosphate synthase MoaC [Desulfovibrio sp. OttesenSCG-928-F07]